MKNNSSPDSASDPEKSTQVPYNATGYEDDLHVPCPSHTTERKLMTKVDFRVIPFLCILYLLAFLDRVNISNASLFGLREELRLDGNKYNNALVIFFIPYIILEIPSNILLKKFKPHVWLSICMFGFGAVTLIQGFVNNYAGLLATRFFLGVFETGMFPGCFYLIGMWYKRSEAQKRYSFFFSSTTLAGAFGGLLAAAIGKMNGVRGYLGWRWIFILEGLFTCIVSFTFFFLIPDFPEEAKWLSEDERAYISARLRADQGRSARDRKITGKDVANVFKDFKVWIGGFMYLGLIVPAYGYAYFAPNIIRTYGYSPIRTQLFSVPPWAVAFFFSMLMAYLSDKIRHRFAFTMIGTAIGLVGFGILVSVTNYRSLQYGSLFLVTMGTYSTMPIIVCWFNMNLGGHHRRSVGSAWQIGFGNIGGIIAVYAFLQKDAPRFIPGYSICLGFTALAILSCIAYFFACRMQNRQREKAPRDVGLTEYERTELGDLNPDYRYQL
ncbi:major facilitator superfamily domain-containing protein [Elsinoe ampelina]|uniref:Major facilitator superfamily domain-containing protein n=1 Tax=Elsinoe ampelina TaxID=302913 RepID=A0A6A6GDK4_9PEZI|nr:major facilitator superfamily domain-containing protein [Elsinoe ampelina]